MCYATNNIWTLWNKKDCFKELSIIFIKQNHLLLYFTFDFPLGHTKIGKVTKFWGTGCFFLEFWGWFT